MEAGSQRCVQARLVDSGGGRRHVAQQPVRKIAPQHRADLRDFARFAEPVRARGERLLQGRRDRLGACPPRCARAGGRVTSSTNSGPPPDRSPTRRSSRRRRAMLRLRRSRLHHPADLRAVERRREATTVVASAWSVGRAELRPRRRHDEQVACWLRAPPATASDREGRDSAECRSSKDCMARLRTRSREIPRRHRRELQSPQFLHGANSSPNAPSGNWNVDQRRDKGAHSSGSRPTRT